MTRKRVDSTQGVIFAALRADGWTVEDIHEHGQGCPDGLASKGHLTILVECKSPGGKLNLREARWHAAWPGIIIIPYSPEDAVVQADYWWREYGAGRLR